MPALQAWGGVWRQYQLFHMGFYGLGVDIKKIYCRNCAPPIVLVTQYNFHIRSSSAASLNFVNIYFLIFGFTDRGLRGLRPLDPSARVVGPE